MRVPAWNLLIGCAAREVAGLGEEGSVHFESDDAPVLNKVERLCMPVLSEDEGERPVRVFPTSSSAGMSSKKREG